MQFGALTSRQAIDSRFKQLRAQSRQELLTQIYGQQKSSYIEPSIEKQLSDTFSALLHNYEFDNHNPIVHQISQLFSIDLDNLKKMDARDRKTYIENKIQGKIEEQIRIVDRIASNHEQVKSSHKSIQHESNHFEWLGVDSKYTQLRPIFEQILLEKVKMFDRELTQLTQLPQELPYDTFQTATTARLDSQRPGKAVSHLKSRTVSTMNMRHKRVQSSIQPEFTNVKIRDKSEFLLKAWTRNEQQQFLSKKAVFKSNLKINNIPVLFQFVKKYTNTVKARDNIYRKWENRQKLGISPEELRYLCATSLFLNKTMARSQKVRVKNNIRAAGPRLISRLQLNIAEKIIETYHQLMKKVSDLRAKYYEQLTQERKLEQYNSAVVDQTKTQKMKKQFFFLKYKATFTRIVNSEKMKLKLNPNIMRWVQHFISKLYLKIGQRKANKVIPQVFKRLATQQNESRLMYRHKAKYPSSKIIKRQDMYSHRLKYRKYIPSERFQYDKQFQETIEKMNRVKLNRTFSASYHNQLTGGPKKRTSYIVVDLSKKKIFMSSPIILKYIVKIQAKWKAVFLRKKYLSMIEDVRQKKKQEFRDKLSSIYKIYPPGKKIDMKMVENRLKRINMKITNIIKPYERAVKRPINVFTSFCVNKLTNVELKSKHDRNGTIRLAQFLKLVESNHYHQLKKSGIVVTDKEINNCVMSNGANPMWWAVYHSNFDLANLFLQGGGDPNSKDSEGQTCLHMAVKNGAVPIIFTLLDYGADLNRKNNKKVTAIYYATSRMLKLLGLEEGGLFGEKDNNAAYFRRSVHSEIYKDHHY